LQDSWEVKPDGTCAMLGKSCREYVFSQQGLIKSGGQDAPHYKVRVASSSSRRQSSVQQVCVQPAWLTKSRGQDAPHYKVGAASSISSSRRQSSVQQVCVQPAGAHQVGRPGRPALQGACCQQQQQQQQQKAR
jgi:hypothetical protein